MTALTPAAKDRRRTAQARVKRIRAGIKSYIHTLGDIAAAYAADDWKTLGYTSWATYVATEFGAHEVGLPAEQRQKAIDELRLAGMPNRAIATALNVHEKTIRRDTGAANAAPIEGEIVGQPALFGEETAGLAGPAPDDEQASVPSGTAAAGDDGAPAAAPDHPGTSGPGDTESAGNTSGKKGAAGVRVPGSPAAGAVTPAAPAAPSSCEKCGEVIAEGQAAEGYTRCDECDPEGEHVDLGEGCRGCRVVAETHPAYVLSFGENEHGLHLKHGECGGVVAHLKPGGSLPEVLAAAREHHATCAT